MNRADPISDRPITNAFLAGRMPAGVSRADIDPLEPLFDPPRRIADGEVLVARAVPVSRATMLLEGFLFRTIFKDGRRFVVGLHVPGDFVDLHAFMLKRLDHQIVAAGPARVAQIGHEVLRGACARNHQLQMALWFATLLDAAIHRQWIRNLEGLDAAQRIAHLYAEIHHRLALIGQGAVRTLRTPFTQTDLADMCGVSAIHANRAVARLRELSLGEIRRGDLYSANWPALHEYAGFDPAYLYGTAALNP